jgi:predicted AAA+ superfamily ATPase
LKGWDWGIAMEYRARVVDAELRRALASAGAVVIEGPKACGKTLTARQVAASELRVDTDPRVPPAIAVDPGLLLDGAPPQLLDEWQVQPSLWNHVRRAVDDRHQAGQFILTGSATPDDDAARHSGAGRFARIRMRPMSLLESGHSTGTVALSALLAGEPIRASGPDLALAVLIERVLTGGWPGLQSLGPTDASRAVRDYLATIQQVDVSRVAGPRRDPVKVGRVIAAIARNVATEASIVTLARDAASEGEDTARHTVSGYLDVLERLMVVEDQPAWSTHLRSSATLRKSPKRHFVDPSLAAAALRATPETLLADLNFFGLLFESLVIRDLRVYAQAADGAVYHYRDSTGLEVDVIVEMGDGRWGAFEVKLGASQIDTAAAGLLRFRDRVDTSRVGEPSVLGIITPSGLGYRRPDGVSVVPIGALGP